MTSSLQTPMHALGVGAFLIAGDAHPWKLGREGLEEYIKSLDTPDGYYKKIFDRALAQKDMSEYCSTMTSSCEKPLMGVAGKRQIRILRKTPGETQYCTLRTRKRAITCKNQLRDNKKIRYHYKLQQC